MKNIIHSKFENPEKEIKILNNLRSNAHRMDFRKIKVTDEKNVSL